MNVDIMLRNRTGGHLSDFPETRIPARIFIDCTETYLSGFTTGIQRVVRSIVDRADLMSREADVPCTPVVALGGRFYPLSHFPSLQNKSSRRGRFFDAGKALYHWADRVWQRSPFSGRVRGKGDRRKDFSTVNPGSVPSLRAQIKQFGRAVLMRLSTLFLRVRAGEAVKPVPGDLLLMPDMFWGIGDPIRAASDFKKKGGTVVPVIHDLIPLRFPQYCHEGTVYAFCRTLPEIIDLASGILTVSKSTLKDLEEYLRDRFPHRSFPLDFFYPGADILPKGSPSLPVRQEFERVGTEAPFYLMVGAIQPHKAHMVVLDAFERLWERGFTGKLFILGRVGGKGDEVLERIRSSPHLGKDLFVWHDANDAELDVLYRHTRALIMASYAEGFGLPIVEAMDKAVPVIASDLPVFREIAGEHPVYFASGSAEDLQRVLTETQNKGNRAVQEYGRGWIRWDDAVKILLERLAVLYEE